MSEISQSTSGSARILTHNLGPHPLIQHFIQRMNLEEILRESLGSARGSVLDHAQTLCALIHNILVSPGPLYRIAIWAEPVEPHVLGLTALQKEALNDDRVARALDALVSESARGVWFRLALRVIKQFKINTQQVHCDTTTVTFCGKYKASVSEPRLAFGHNKDHRPDLKQLLFGLTVSRDGAVPIHHFVRNGNTSDNVVHQENLEDVRRILGRDDFTYVADSKLCTVENLGHLTSFGGNFVTVMPRTWREDKQFRETLREGKVRWKRILQIPNHRRESEDPDSFCSCEGLDKTEQGYRLVWIRSSQKQKDDRLFREAQLRRADLEFAELGLKLNRRQLRTEGAIRTAVNEILKRLKVENLLHVTLKQRTQLIPHHLKPGRPAADSTLQMEKQKSWSLHIRRNLPEITRQKRTDGVFPLITNLERLPKKEILLMYKYQPHIEKRFASLKTDLEIAPVYLKKPGRVAGLIHAYFLALTVGSLMERELRNAMVTEKVAALALLPENRYTKTPTCPTIMDAFSRVGWQEFNRGAERVVFPVELSPLQEKLLSMFKAPLEIYR